MKWKSGMGNGKNKKVVRELWKAKFKHDIRNGVKVLNNAKFDASEIRAVIDRKNNIETAKLVKYKSVKNKNIYSTVKSVKLNTKDATDNIKHNKPIIVNSTLDDAKRKETFKENPVVLENIIDDKNKNSGKPLEIKYKSSGKKYNGEKAIISLTSWKARVNTVGKTLFSLIKQCPGFHIVLVLSEEEFPKMEKELPDELMLFVKNNLIELLWVYKNYKAFKKVLFTMDKYREVPVISADDDCIYKYNYAEELYENWLKYKCIISNTKSFGSGYGILFVPNCFNHNNLHLTNNILQTNHDDFLYKFLAKINNRKIHWLYRIKECNKKIIFHDDNNSITSTYNPYEKKNRSIFEKEFKFKLNDNELFI